MTTTFPHGFRAASVSAGLRETSTTADLALLVNDGPQQVAAGVFTTNRVKAAPVRYTQNLIDAGLLSAVVLNAGGANACTGPDGYADTVATAHRVANALNTDADKVAVCSTGLIGERLNIDALLAGVDLAAAALSPNGGEDAAAAILTTDSRAKTIAHQHDGYRIGGMAKGAGMLAPALATMLCVITTDAAIEATLADIALRQACATTFDRLDSDGCASTNDTVLLLASGASGVSPDPEVFAEALRVACADLAAQLLADAEGATKNIAIEVVQAASDEDAVEVGRAVARNNLFKCAMFGNDPNWGRVLAAIGTTSAVFDPDQLDVAINGVWVCRAGAAAADRSTVDLSGIDVNITIALHAGSDTATIYTNDLSIGYVHENSAYSS